MIEKVRSSGSRVRACNISREFSLDQTFIIYQREEMLVIVSLLVVYATSGAAKAQCDTDISECTLSVTGLDNQTIVIDDVCIGGVINWHNMEPHNMTLTLHIQRKHEFDMCLHCKYGNYVMTDVTTDEPYVVEQSTDQQPDVCIRSHPIQDADHWIHLSLEPRSDRFIDIRFSIKFIEV